jgi:inorganic pyrophosphatase
MNIKYIFPLVMVALAFIPTASAENYSSVSCWENNVFDKKIYIFDKKGPQALRMVSPFHDIKLARPKNAFNMVVEIPKGTVEKIEINKGESFNPLMFDIKDDKVRKITYKAKHSKIAGYPFHYGAVPQTWEHVGMLDPHTATYGDNDPIDAFDISDIKRKPGDVIAVKVLGAIAMIDSGETDWKLITINVDDKMAAKYNNYTELPFGVVESIYDFLLNYKTSEGKGQNKFYEKVYWSKNEALKIIKEMHDNWKKLCQDPKGTRDLVGKNRPDKVKEIPSCENPPDRILDNAQGACIID